jgi:UDP-N-acetylmuramyl pentapeptide phosphotransferase/UDP-N-acetylglucosamine-1-phosphate transferase
MEDAYIGSFISKDACIGLFISFVLVSTLWIVQIFFRKTKTLCLCSTISFAVIVALEVLRDCFPANYFLLRLLAYLLVPGVRVITFFVNPWLVAHHQKGLFWVYIFSLIFYTVVFWGIVESILYVKKKYFCSKTN